MDLKAYWLVITGVVVVVEGHGRLMEPPSRSSLWRFGYQVKKNYDDNFLNCGGKARQWTTNNGQCGVCGDPFDGERENEAGGRYAAGLIVKSYAAGQPINIRVEITSAHGGWFEFRICPNNDTSRAITQDCLDQYLLQSSTGVTRYDGVPTGGEAGAGYITLQYNLPPDLTCTQCVLQWKYHTAKDWGCDATCGLGHGSQEEFYGCADIAIRAASIQPTTRGSTTTTTKSQPPQTSRLTPTPVAATTTTTPGLTRVTTKTSVGTTTAATSTSTAQTRTTAIPTSTTTTTPQESSRPTSKRHGTAYTSPLPTLSTPAARDILACQGRGSLEGTVMDNRCRTMCLAGECLLAFCNDACQALVNGAFR